MILNIDFNNLFYILNVILKTNIYLHVRAGTNVVLINNTPITIYRTN